MTHPSGLVVHCWFLPRPRQNDMKTWHSRGRHPKAMGFHRWCPLRPVFPMQNPWNSYVAISWKTSCKQNAKVCIHLWVSMVANSLIFWKWFCSVWLIEAAKYRPRCWIQIQWFQATKPFGSPCEPKGQSKPDFLDFLDILLSKEVMDVLWSKKTEVFPAWACNSDRKCWQQSWFKTRSCPPKKKTWKGRGH